MGGNYFEQLGRELLQMKRLMDKLQEENRELRQQLAELREGRGIFIQVGDQRFALHTNNEGDVPENLSAQSGNTSTPTEVTDNTALLLEKSAVEGTLSLTNAEKEPAPAEATKAKEVTFLEEVMIDEFASTLTSPVPATPDTKEVQKNVSKEQQERLRHELQGSYLLE